MINHHSYGPIPKAKSHMINFLHLKHPTPQLSTEIVGNQCIFLLQNKNLWHFQFMLIFSGSFSDEVIAKCRTLNWERNEMGKIYDLLFVRVVKMCPVSSFHTKDIKLDSINSRELEECPVHKSDVENLQCKKLLGPMCALFMK